MLVHRLEFCFCHHAFILACNSLCNSSSMGQAVCLPRAAGLQLTSCHEIFNSLAIKISPFLSTIQIGRELYIHQQTHRLSRHLHSWLSFCDTAGDPFVGASIQKCANTLSLGVELRLAAYRTRRRYCRRHYRCAVGPLAIGCAGSSTSGHSCQGSVFQPLPAPTLLKAPAPPIAPALLYIA